MPLQQSFSQPASAYQRHSYEPVLGLTRGRRMEERIGRTIPDLSHVGSGTSENCIFSRTLDCRTLAISQYGFNFDSGDQNSANHSLCRVNEVYTILCNKHRILVFNQDGLCICTTAFPRDEATALPREKRSKICWSALLNLIQKTVCSSGNNSCTISKRWKFLMLKNDCGGQGRGQTSTYPVSITSELLLSKVTLIVCIIL